MVKARNINLNLLIRSKQLPTPHGPTIRPTTEKKPLPCNIRWIGRGQEAPINSPPRPPDLNALDFYFWGHLKNTVYSTEVNTIEELHERIFNISNKIKTSIQTLRSAIPTLQVNSFNPIIFYQTGI
ncbi:hypothetical protein YQE_09659, partial [Dendroctonus ponderosae]